MLEIRNYKPNLEEGDQIYLAESGSGQKHNRPGMAYVDTSAVYAPHAIDHGDLCFPFKSFEHDMNVAVKFKPSVRKAYKTLIISW